MSKEQLHNRIDHDGHYHKVDDQVIMDKMASIREQTLALGHRTIDLVPEGRELSMALTALFDEFLVMAIAALARNQEAVLGEHNPGQMMRKLD